MKLSRFSMYQSFYRRKKLFYVITSVILSTGLICTGVLDLIILLVVERPDLTTHNAMTTIMILHTISFYMALFGFVHSYESKLYVLTKISIIAASLTLVSLLFRIVQELILAGFYPTEYAVT